MSRGAALVAAALALFAAAPASAAEEFGSECPESNFECTLVTVPLDRSGSVPGTIPLYVERFPGGGREAVIALAGGPGQGNSSVTESFNREISPALGRDEYLVVFDQRGTGRSGALDCPELERPTSAPLDVRAEACAMRLGPPRGFYTTRDSVEDLEAVRRRLGDERITLYGVSYGTLVALAYARRYPEHVERLVLDSVVPPEGQSPFDLDTFAAMPRVLREICRGECRGITPDLATDVATLAERMRAAPLRGPWVDRRGRRRTVQMTTRDLYSRIRVGDFNAGVRAEYPGAIRSAVEGDPAPLLRIEHRFDGLVDPDQQPVPEDAVRTLSFTLFTTTLCEEAPLPWERGASPEERIRQARERAAAIPDAAFGPFGRETALTLDDDSLLLQCRRWPTAVEAPPPATGPMPDVPVLVLEGKEDLRTPLESGERVARLFPRAQLVGVPKTAHGVLGARGASCAGVALRRFFAGSAVGSPCVRVKREARVRPRLPASLPAVPRARGTRGLPGRTLEAARLTLDDLYREYFEVGLVADGPPRGGGLRGGRYALRGRSLVLERFSLVPGVNVSGRLTGTRRPVGTLRVTGIAGARGTLTLARDGTLSGRLSGRAVRTRFRLPAAAAG